MTIGEPAKIEQPPEENDVTVAQLVFEAPGPICVSLNTRLGNPAKVKNALGLVGGAEVKSPLLIVIPFETSRHPAEPVTPDAQPAKERSEPLVTSEFPPPIASGSELKVALVRFTVTVPAVPVPNVPTTVAQALDAIKELPANKATGAKINRTKFFCNLHLRGFFVRIHELYGRKQRLQA